MRKVVIINSHPIQYAAPMYRFFVEKNLDMEAWYCSQPTKDVVDKGFGIKVQWDVPLLEGYPIRFFKNLGWGAGFGFFGLINLGLIKAILQQPKNTIIWVNGWAFASFIIATVVAKISGKEVWMRGDNTLSNELKAKGAFTAVRRFFINRCLFALVDYFLYVGNQNRKYYKHSNVDDAKLIFVPHAVDNARWRSEFLQLKENIGSTKKELKVKQEKVVLFVGKYIPIKRPLDLIKAFANLQRRDTALVMVGEGELRTEMEALVKDLNVENIFLTGFVNQSLLPLYYSISDVFVLCSDSETWGLAVNEAMNFNLPIVVSDTVGCGEDLVMEGENGYVFKKGDIQALQDCIDAALAMNKSRCKSIDVINSYSYQAIVDQLYPKLN